MIRAQRGATAWSLMGQAEQHVGTIWRNGNDCGLPQAHGSAATALCRASVEVGAGRRCWDGSFSGQGPSYTMRNFEDVVIFVADMEQAIERLNALEKTLAMNVWGIHDPEVARLLGCTSGRSSDPYRMRWNSFADLLRRVDGKLVSF